MSEQAKPRLAVLASRLRMEENLIFSILEQRNIAYDRLDERTLTFLAGSSKYHYAAVLNRSISHTSGLYMMRLLEASHIRTINSSRVIEICGDKLQTTLAFVQAGVPTPKTMVAFTPEAALEAIESIGYPVVLKPLIGSWGRLLAKVNDREAAEAILEHKQNLGAPLHKVFYIQEYINKVERDIRTIVIGNEVVSAMYRYSKHWITNTARGAETRVCAVTAELGELSLRAASAVGGGILAVDLLEQNGALLVNEVNHTMEFHGMIAATGTDIAGCLVDYIEKVARL
jgi:[lysine-biosynthesis-protein LysW]---L-2-aminoadipate ligase